MFNQYGGNGELNEAHLGNGCSITAIDGGNSIDTSMGFTPLEGLVMGTRSGDIDPAIIFYLMSKKQLTHQKVNELLNDNSGLSGLAEIDSSDLRDLIEAQRAGSEQAAAAV